MEIKTEGGLNKNDHHYQSRVDRVALEKDPFAFAKFITLKINV